MRGRWIAWVCTVTVAGCCRAPQDPDDPGASQPAKSAKTFLETIRDGDDERAWALTHDFYRFERTPAEFTERIDAFPTLRNFEDVRFDRVHYVSADNIDEKPFLERCMHRALSQGVEVDAVLIDGAGTETLVALRGGKRLQWSGIKIDGRALMPDRPVPKNPNWKPPPTPPPAKPPKPAEIVNPDPPPDAVDGKWTIREYEVDLEPPPGAWLATCDATFGLQVALDPPDRIGSAKSKLKLRTNCEGLCRPETFDERIEKELGKRVLENMAREMGSSSWIQRPTKRPDGSWWMHVRGEGGESRPRERVLYAFMSPDSKRAWLECEIDATGPELETIDDLAKLCADLSWTHVGETDAAPEKRFGATYSIREHRLRVQTPDGFRFSKYEPLFTGLEFKGKDNILDSFRIQAGCAGTCTADRLRENIDKAFTKRLENLESEGRAPKIELPLTERDGLLFSRVSLTVFDGPAVQVNVTAIPKGASRFVRCEARLYGDATARADELESACKTALVPLVDE